jgi:2-amino-4-hydroxy-6-hydroxymethyldihydropteridine diphosphokinase
MSGSPSATVQAWIALGSNIDPVNHLPWAVRELSRLGALQAVSSVWQSKPVGDEAQADFCNAAVLLETTLPPSHLKEALRQIETHLGRVRVPGNKNAPRTIDLDLAFYGNTVCEQQELRIPDPEIRDRPFLAIPLAELNPRFQHPVTGESLGEIAAILGGTRSLHLRNDILLEIPTG